MPQFLHAELCRSALDGLLFAASAVTSNVASNSVLQAPGYFSVVQRAMDFTTMRAKVHGDSYSAWQEFQVQAVTDRLGMHESSPHSCKP